jgi:exopolysaccharide biosynthesis polyprenyl glycosylphosphotransferase
MQRCITLSNPTRASAGCGGGGPGRQATGIGRNGRQMKFGSYNAPEELADVALDGGPQPAGPRPADGPVGEGVFDADTVEEDIAGQPQPLPLRVVRPTTGDARPRQRSGVPSTPRLESALLLFADLVAILSARIVTQEASLPGLLYACGVIWMMLLSGTYRSRLTYRALDDLPRWLSALALPLLLAVPLLSLGPWGAYTDLHPTFLAMVLATTVGVVAARSLVYILLLALRRRRVLADRTVIVGAGTLGRELARLLLDRPVHGLVPVGMVDSLPSAARENLPVPHLGTIDDLDQVLRRHEVRRVIVAFGPMREGNWVGVMRAAVINDVEIHIVPRFFDLAVSPRDANVDEIWGIPLYRVRRAALRSGAWRVKRAVDLVLACIALVISAPLLGLIALAVRLTDPDGPVLFRQQRVGQNGRVFEMLKFRTIQIGHEDAVWRDPDGHEYTPIGMLLRKTSLDELPQLWNVLRGCMSIVGPRPERPHFAAPFAEEVPGYADRHRLPVGLTGWAQVSGLRGETSIAERARFDNFYIEHWSLWFDIKVILRTSSTVIRDLVVRR